MPLGKNNNIIYVLQVFVKNSHNKYVREVFTYDSHEEALIDLCNTKKHKNSLYKGDYHDIRNYLANPYQYISIVSDSEVESAVPVNALREILKSSED